MDVDLSDFCDKTVSAVRKPFALGDWLYATDRRVCVRVPLKGQAVETPDAKPPSADKLPYWELFGDTREWKPLTAPKEKEFQFCGTCDGMGVVICNFDHEHECPACDEGESSNWGGVEVDGLQFAVCLLHKAARLPGVEYATVKEGTTEAPLMLLKFDSGGQGIVMGQRQD